MHKARLQAQARAKRFRTDAAGMHLYQPARQTQTCAKQFSHGCGSQLGRQTQPTTQEGRATSVECTCAAAARGLSHGQASMLCFEWVPELGVSNWGRRAFAAICST